MSDRLEPRRETMATTLPAEGARIGIVTCLACGAALLLDPRDDFDVVELHRRWHEQGQRG